MVAFICTLLVGFAGVAGVILYGRRRPVGAPLSWGEAMAAAMFAMFLLLWWYGVIPHQWLTWAEGELGWRSDRLLAEPTGNQPLTVSYKTLADIIAVVIYGVGIALHIGLWAVWNDRGKKKPAEVPASRYGRPLVRKG
ncbi:MAG: hypothetical protein C0P77_016525 [Thermoanaerobacterales bacterium]|nr:hypothetical protein [Thermoanaerobacterales bacterium]